eukprot:gene1300-750_t
MNRCSARQPCVANGGARLGFGRFIFAIIILFIDTSFFAFQQQFDVSCFFGRFQFIIIIIIIIIIILFLNRKRRDLLLGVEGPGDRMERRRALFIVEVLVEYSRSAFPSPTLHSEVYRPNKHTNQTTMETSSFGLFFLYVMTRHKLVPHHPYFPLSLSLSFPPSLSYVCAVAPPPWLRDQTRPDLVPPASSGANKQNKPIPTHLHLLFLSTITNAAETEKFNNNNNNNNSTRKGEIITRQHPRRCPPYLVAPVCDAMSSVPRETSHPSPRTSASPTPEKPFTGLPAPPPPPPAPAAAAAKRLSKEPKTKPMGRPKSGGNGPAAPPADALDVPAPTPATATAVATATPQTNSSTDATATPPAAPAGASATALSLAPRLYSSSSSVASGRDTAEASNSHLHDDDEDDPNSPHTLDTHERGTASLARTVMRWAIPTQPHAYTPTVEAAEVSTFGAAASSMIEANASGTMVLKSPTRIFAAGGSFTEANDLAGVAESESPEAAHTKAQRLKKVVRDLQTAKRYLLEKMEAMDRRAMGQNDNDSVSSNLAEDAADGTRPKAAARSAYCSPLADDATPVTPTPVAAGTAPKPRRASLRTRLMETLRSVATAVREMEGEGEDVTPTPVRRGSMPSNGVYPGPQALSQPPTPPPALSTGACDFADPLDSGSPFFHSPSALESSGNRLKETILALNRPAQTDAELLWLFRHSRLLCLLPRSEQLRAVASSLRREFARGETILEKGAPIRHLYVVVWGAVDAFQIVENGADGPSAHAGHGPRAPPPPPPSASAAQGKQPFFSATAKSLPQSAGNVVRRLSGSVNVPLKEMNFSPAASSSPAPISNYTLPPSSGSPTREAPSGASASLLAPAAIPNMYYYPAGGFRNGVGVHQGTLPPGQIFGVEQCVFDGTSDFCFRASLNYVKTVVMLIPISVMRPFLQRNTRFAQGAGDMITAAVDVFRPIREFCRSVFSASTDENEYLKLWAIVESYTRLENVIHTKLSSREVDTGAWGYALNRLPANVTTTFCFNLVHALPPFVASRMRLTAQAADVRQQASHAARDRTSRTAIAFIMTKERRRCTWHLGMEGKTLVLLRDGFTDLLDFLTMLCVHIIESNKLRGRLQGMVHPPAIDILDAYLQQREDERLSSVPLTEEAEIHRVKHILASMPLTESEQQGLMRLWGADTALKMYEIMMHREEYNVRVDTSLSRKFQINPFHEWALNLRACVLKKIGLNVVDPLPEDLYIDVVSSNTHCIKNLLSSFNRTYKREVLAYARRCEVARLGPWEEWHNEDDILYAALPGFLQNERPDLKEEYSRSLEQNGITVLNDTAMTGLQVDVIPVHALNLDTIDGAISRSAKCWFKSVFCRTSGDVGTEESELESSIVSGQRSPRGEEGHGGTASSSTSSPTGGAAPPSAIPPQPHRRHTSHVGRDGKVRPSWTQMSKPVYDENGVFTGKSSPGCPVEDRSEPQSPTPPEVLEQLDTPFAEGGFDDASPRAVPLHPTGVFRHHRHFIINMDFAFGAQAEGICRAVFSAFGHRIRSVSIMGKAGGMMGKRGDIQLASHVLMSKSSFIIEDNQDELRNCRNDDLTRERLQELAGPRVSVFAGNVLTVTGTMLQNVRLLRYYQRVWGCVGMEMEGSYFARVIEDFHQQGITRPDMISRFAYYTSDLPLAASDAEEAGDDGESETLSAPMTPLEGVPPLYAIARGILERIVLP